MKFFLKIKNQITKNEIENKFQLKIVNVNKIIINKRLLTKSKENIYGRANMIFCIASTQTIKENE